MFQSYTYFAYQMAEAAVDQFTRGLALGDFLTVYLYYNCFIIQALCDESAAAISSLHTHAGIYILQNWDHVVSV